MARVLVVAYGNPLRCDDGIAWRAADALEGRFSGDEVEILRLHQLVPELAEIVSRFATVIFIDAAAGGAKTIPGQIQVKEIAAQARADASGFAHVISPQTVTALAATLYSAKPQTFLLTVTAASFDHGDVLSLSVEAALPDLISKVAWLVEQSLSRPSATKDTK